MNTIQTLKTMIRFMSFSILVRYQLTYVPSLLDLYSKYFVKISSTVGERGSLTNWQNQQENQYAN